METLRRKLWSSANVTWAFLIGCFVVTFTHGQILTPQDAKNILKKHNEYRRQESAADMYLMHWNVSLQQRADSWAHRCLFKHERNTDLGENLYFDTDHKNEVFIRGMEAWHNEKSSWWYTSQSCTSSCHFTQLIWGYTTTVGCSANVCPSLNVAGRTIKDAMFMVCYYYPRGNFIGIYPYEKGNPCSKCAAGDTCSDGLCVTSGPVSKLAPEFVRQLAPQGPVGSSSHSFQAFKSLIQEFSSETSHTQDKYHHQSSHRTEQIHHHHQQQQHHFKTDSVISLGSESRSYTTQHHEHQQNLTHNRQQHVFEQQHRANHWLQEERRRQETLLQQMQEHQEQIRLAELEKIRLAELEKIRQRMNFEKETQERENVHKEVLRRQEEEHQKRIQLEQERLRRLQEGQIKHEAHQTQYLDLNHQSQKPGIDYDHSRSLVLTNNQEDTRKLSHQSVDRYSGSSTDHSIGKSISFRADNERTPTTADSVDKILYQGETASRSISHGQVHKSGTSILSQVKTYRSSVISANSKSDLNGESKHSVDYEDSDDDSGPEGLSSQLGEARRKHLRKKWQYRQQEIRRLTANHPHKENYVIDTNGRRCVDRHSECTRWAAKCHKSSAVTLSCPMTCGKCSLNLGLDQIQKDQTTGNDDRDRTAESPDRIQRMKRRYDQGRKEITAADREARRLQAHKEQDPGAPSALMAHPETQSDNGRPAARRAQDEQQQLLRNQRRQARQQQKQAKQLQKQVRQQQRQARQQQTHAQQQQKTAQEQQMHALQQQINNQSQTHAQRQQNLEQQQRRLAQQRQMHAQEQQKLSQQQLPHEPVQQPLQKQDQQQQHRQPVQEHRQARPGLCRDDPKHIRSCKFWAKKGFCLDNRLIGNLYCPLSCNTCG